MPTEDQLRQLPRDGITTDLQNGGKLEIEQQMAGMRPPAPLVFMNRRNDGVALTGSD